MTMAHKTCVWLGTLPEGLLLAELTPDDILELPDEITGMLNHDDTLVLPWRLGLSLLDSDLVADAGSLHLDWPSPGSESWHQLYQWLSDAQMPPVVPARLYVSAQSTPGRHDFGLQAEWKGLDQRRYGTMQRCGGLLSESGRPEYRLTAGQYGLFENLEHIDCGRGDRNADLAAISQVKAFVPSNDPGIQFDTYLERQEVSLIEGIAPRLVPVKGGYQVRPHVEGISDRDLEDYFYQQRWKDEVGGVLQGKTPDGRRLRHVMAPKARRGLTKISELNIISAEDAAKAHSVPRSFYGDDLELSDRISGYGPAIRTVVPILQRSQVGNWWSWSGEFELASPFGDEDSVQSSLHLTPETILTLRKSIETAFENGSRYCPHPEQPGVLLEINAQFLELLARYEDEHSGESTSRKLQVKDNLEDLDYLGALGQPESPQRPYQRPAELLQRWTLKPYQQEGVQWLQWVDRLTPGDAPKAWDGAMLADDMGLGKTLQVLAHLNLLKLRGRSGPHLVVAPVALLENWQAEVKKFFGQAFDPIFLVRGASLPNQPRDAAAILRSYQLVLVSYETLRRREFAFAAVGWDVIALDEAQKAKNPDTQIARVLQTLRSNFKLCMTGTPVENRLREMWTLFNWAVPGLLGSLSQFRTTFIEPLEDASHEERCALANRLIEIIGPVFVRRMKDEVLADELPEKKHQRVFVNLSAHQERAYSKIIAEATNNRRNRLGTLPPLFGVCAHPAIVSERDLPPLADMRFEKGEKLFEIIDGVREKNEKVLIFVNRIVIQKWIQRECGLRYAVKPSIINGSVTSSLKRLQLVQTFNDSQGFNALVLAPRAAGVGLNITGANHVIHYMREWNPAVENQATDRAYRLGQNRDVTVYTIVSRSSLGRTVEERLDELLGIKRKLMEDFVIPMGGSEVTTEELLEDP